MAVNVKLKKTIALHQAKVSDSCISGKTNPEEKLLTINKLYTFSRLFKFLLFSKLYL